MKITVFVAHSGIQNMLRDLLEDHEVSWFSNSNYSVEPTKKPSDQIVISTFPYRELEYLPLTQKIIVYATDPFPDPGIFLSVQDRPNTVVVGDIDGLIIYPKIQYPIQPRFEIPHSIKGDRYPKYKGNINAVAIINRKPYYRWLECSYETLGRTTSLEEFLSEVPYHVLHIPDNKDFFETISHYKGVFYYSNNPYTLAMFELMAMQMPMVAFGGCRYGTTVMNKYLGKTYIDTHLVKKAIYDTIENKNPVVYPIFPFEEAKRKWNEVLQYVAQL